MSSFKDRISGKFMLTYNGTNAVPPAPTQDWLRNHETGGLTFFRWNVEDATQARTLTDALQQAYENSGKGPLLIAADQEGGLLIALEPLTPFPGNMALGATHDPELAYEVGRATAKEMRAIGINVNYAPVCDLNTNRQNPSTSLRTFSDDVELAAQMAEQMVQGLQSEGVAATIKHFPGLGEASTDTHHGLALIKHSLERLEAIEIAPFKRAIEAGAKMVMSGHFAIPALAGTANVPATLSRKVMTDYLRGSLGFEGLVITDGLGMRAIKQGEGQIDDIVTAIQAGIDLLLFDRGSNPHEKIYEGLQRAYEQGLLDDTDITASLQRIEALKQWIASFPQPDFDVVRNTDHLALADRVAERAITLVRNDANLLPLNIDSKPRIAAIMPEPRSLSPADSSGMEPASLARALRSQYMRVDEYVTTYPPDTYQILSFMRQVQNYDLVIFGTIDAFKEPRQVEYINKIMETGTPVITVAMRSPYDLEAYPESQTHICTYSVQRVAMDALAKTIFGVVPFTGRLPVTMGDLYPFGHGIVTAEES